MLPEPIAHTSRLAPMSTTPARLARPLVLLAILSLTIAACSSGAASVPPGGSASPPASEQPAPSDPDSPVTGPSDPGLGGDGGPKVVVPRPGTINPHPVSIQSLEPTIDGRHVTVKATWTSGVEPCYVLDSVIVNQDGNNIAITVVEGSGQADAICIEIAETKATIVDLGDLEPGDYTIEATDSTIPPVTITVA